MNEKNRTYFEFFTQVGIIAQLSETMFSNVLPDGLHMSHFTLLNNLMRLGDGKTPLELATAFQVPKGTMTYTLKVLTARGLILQERNIEDKRSKLVYLTDTGRAYHGQALQAMGHAVFALEDRMPFEDMKNALPVLNELRAILDAHRSDDPLAEV